MPHVRHRRTGFDAHEDEVGESLGVERVGRGPGVERGHGREAEVLPVAEREQTGDLERLGCAGEQHPHPVTDVEPVAPRGAGIHRDLAVAQGTPAVHDPGRPDRLPTRPRDAQGRCAEGLDRRAVIVLDELRVADQERIRRRHPVDLADLLGQLARDALPARRAVTDLTPGRDHEVAARGVLLEDLAE